MSKSHGYGMTKPCSNCPFRSDRPFRLNPERAEEIAAVLQSGGSFHCHKTIDYNRFDDEEGAPYPAGTEEHCAGALIILEREGNPSQMMRISERLGFYDASKLDMDAPVYEDFEAFIDAMYDLDSVAR